MHRYTKSYKELNSIPSWFIDIGLCGRISFMKLTFSKLTDPTPEIAATLDAWENNPELVPFFRPMPSKKDLGKKKQVTVDSLRKRLQHNQTFLIYADGQMVGEMNYQVDPARLLKKEPGTAWIGIDIGEESARGKGIGRLAMEYLENQISQDGLHRIELGVFEFNLPAIKLYQKMGYQEIGRIDDFTYYQGKMWQDIRMEKYLKNIHHSTHK